MSWLEKKEDTFKNFYDGECLKKKNETSSHFSFQVYIFFKISDTHYCLGSVMGPHPFPTIVRDFQAVISKEIKEQILQKEGRQAVGRRGGEQTGLLPPVCLS